MPNSPVVLALADYYKKKPDLARERPLQKLFAENECLHSWFCPPIDKKQRRKTQRLPPSAAQSCRDAAEGTGEPQLTRRRVVRDRLKD